MRAHLRYIAAGLVLYPDMLLYPDMQRIRGSSLAGRIRCTSCDGPLPAELASCPHCDAHVSEPATS